MLFSFAGVGQSPYICPKRREQMKSWFLIVCMMGLLWPAAAAPRKKVGLVLGGGGAKGVAHIGVLKVLEEAGIPVDYIAGTSMGAIVGGLYAIGYGPAEIDSMVSRQDWAMLLSDRVKRSSLSFPEKENSERYIVSLPFGREKKDRLIAGVIKGQNLQNLFSNLTIGYHDSVDFNQLAIPFASVAVNVVDGRDYIFRSGSLPIAMRASMAIPAIFTPVRLDSMVLVDGGLNNNYPADVALDMGADVLIGVDLGTSDLKMLEGLNTPGDVVGQIVALHGYDKYSYNKARTDVLIRPDLAPYNSASFNAVALDTLIDRGEQAARRRWDDLLALKRRIGLSDSLPASGKGHPRRHASPVQTSDTFFIRHIYFEGADPRDEKWLYQISGLKENSRLTLGELQKAMSIVVGTNAFSNVSYKLTGENEQDLLLTVQPKSISSLNAGLRFDTEEIVAVLLNGTLNYRARYRSRVALTGRIGKKTYVRLDYGVERTPLRNLGVSYMFTYHDLDIYHRGDKIVNTTYRHHLAEVGYSDMNWLSFKLHIGARYEYYDYNSFLYTAQNQDYHVRSQGFLSYFAQAHFETLDRRYYPSKGVSLKADYSLYTDNFVTYKGRTPFSALAVDFLSVVPLTSRLSLLPSLTGRGLIGKDPAYPFLNAMGGEIAGKYLVHQIPFAGINHMEIFGNALAVARLNLRQQIGSRHYISLIANYGVHHDDFFNLFKGEHIWGGSLGYAYNSIAGPLNTNFGLSNRNNHLQFYLNLGYSF